MARIRVKNLTKKFKDVTSVDGLTFDTSEGECLALLGPSGAGKTTTFRMIAGLDKPDEGEIYIGDTLVNEVEPQDRDVAMVFQSYALYPNYTVFENLSSPLYPRKLPRDEARKMVEQTAKILRIEHLLQRLPRQLSGGEKQRVAIGRAIIRKPKAYLLDEPLTNLDAKLRVEMRAELKLLQKELKTTTLYATPDYLEAMTIADRVAVINHGRLLQLDTPNVIYRHPTDLFAAGFIGSPSMNFIEGTLVDKDGKMLLDAGEFQYDLGEINVPLDMFAGKDLILGIRPEHVILSKVRAQKDSSRGEVYAVEHSKPEAIVDIKMSARIVGALSVIRAMAPKDFTTEIGDTVWVSFVGDRVHIIDKSSGKVVV